MLVLLGKDITREDYRTSTIYLEQGRLTKDMFVRQHKLGAVWDGSGSSSGGQNHISFCCLVPVVEYEGHEASWNSTRPSLQ